MNNPRYAGAAARLLRKERSETERRSPEGARENGIATILVAMAQRRRQARQRWLAAGAVLGVAAATLLWLTSAATEPAPPSGDELEAVASAANGGAWFSTKDGRQPLGVQTPLPVGALVSTMNHGSVKLELSTGSQLSLQGDTELQLASNTTEQRFVLSSGSMRANVQHLEAGQRFMIVTPDSEIEVVGTSFQLGVLGSGQACGDGLRTRLEVTEGVVEVRADARSWRVEAGQRWPSDCAAQSVVDPAIADRVAESETPDAPAIEKAIPKTRTSNAAAAKEGSSLREQSDLFARAAAAGRQGRTDLSLKLYGALLQRFPNSALAENAVVSRMRLLAHSRPERAKGEARRYLSRFPQGFAREEARRVLGGN